MRCFNVRRAFSLSKATLTLNVTYFWVYYQGYCLRRSSFGIMFEIKTGSQRYTKRVQYVLMLLDKLVYKKSMLNSGKYRYSEGSLFWMFFYTEYFYFEKFLFRTVIFLRVSLCKFHYMERCLFQRVIISIFFLYSESQFFGLFSQTDVIQKGHFPKSGISKQSLLVQRPSGIILKNDLFGIKTFQNKDRFKQWPCGI